MLIPAGLATVGGFAGMRASLPADFFELYSESAAWTRFTIAMLALNGLVGITAQPHMLSHERHRPERARRPHRPDLRHHGQAVLHHRLGPDRPDRRRDGRPAGRHAFATRRTPSAMPACTCSAPGWSA